jgi:hypothetical protein
VRQLSKKPKQVLQKEIADQQISRSSGSKKLWYALYSIDKDFIIMIVQIRTGNLFA